MINNVNNILDWDLEMIKYRVSNNNNSSDASGLHRDLQIQPGGNPKVGIYTCLSYLDSSIMELIPYSHKEPIINILSIIKYFNNKIRIKMNPGDILLFHASLIHRGIFYKNQKNRRLIQLFDCIRKKKYNTLAPQILHQPCIIYCSKNTSNLFQIISKNKLFIEIANFVSYLNVASGYGSKYNYLKLFNLDKYNYLASEANQPRLEPKYNGYEKGNLYIIKKKLKDNKKKDINNLRFFSHYLNNIIIIIIIILLLRYIKIYTIKN